MEIKCIELLIIGAIKQNCYLIIIYFFQKNPKNLTKYI